MNYDYDIFELIKRRYKRLYVIYLLWAIMFIGIHQTMRSLPLLLYGTHESIKLAGSEGQLWFLSCMFWSSLLAGGILHKIKNHFWGKVVFLAAISLLLSVLLNLFHSCIHIEDKSIGLPLAVDVVFLSCAFIFTGKVLSQIIPRIVLLSSVKRFIIIIACLLFIVLGQVETSYVGYPQMAALKVVSIPLFYISGTFVTLGLILLAKELLSNKVKLILFQWMGEHSLELFLVQIIIIEFIRPWKNNFNTFILWLLLMAVTCFLTVIADIFIPIIFGKEWISKKRK